MLENMRSPPDEKRSSHRTIRWMNEAKRKIQDNAPSDVANWRAYESKIPTPDALVACSILENGAFFSKKVEEIIQSLALEWAVDRSMPQNEWWIGRKMAPIRINKEMGRKVEFRENAASKSIVNQPASSQALDFASVPSQGSEVGIMDEKSTCAE